MFNAWFTMAMMKPTYLNLRIFCCILELGHHREAEATGETDAPQDPQRIICEGLLGRQWGSYRSTTKVSESLLRHNEQQQCMV